MASNPQTSLPPTPREPMVDGRGQVSMQWSRWFQQVQRILSFSGGIGWGIIGKVGSKLSDIETRLHSMLQEVKGWTTGVSTVQDRHISDANGKVWQDHVEIVDGNPHGTDHDMLDAVQVLDPTSDDTVQDRHLSDAQAKVWQDHVGLMNNNPHGTDHDMLDGLSDDDHSQYLLLAGRAGQRAVTPLILGGTADNTTVEADGTLKFNGAATNWNDINKSLLPLSTGANVPSIIAVNGATYLKVRGFNGVGTLNELGEGCEILHDYKEGTDIVPHLHWCATTAAAGNVKWQLAYMWVERDGIFGGETIISVTTAASGVAWKDQRVDFPTISGAGHTIGSRFHFVLFRAPSDAADTYGADAAAFDFGIHYERDTLGSRQITAK